MKAAVHSAVLSALATQAIRPPHMPRSRAVHAALSDDEQRGTSKAVLLDTLVRYGPVVFTLRVLEEDKFEASVRRMMLRYPEVSRELAEQETSKRLCECGTYWRDEERPATPSGMQPRAPSEADLLPPVDFDERLMVVSWLLILVISASYITAASLNADTPPADPIVARSVTESLLSLPAASLEGLQ